MKLYQRSVYQSWFLLLLYKPHRPSTQPPHPYSVSLPLCIHVLLVGTIHVARSRNSFHTLLGSACLCLDSCPAAQFCRMLHSTLSGCLHGLSAIQPQLSSTQLSSEQHSKAVTLTLPCARDGLCHGAWPQCSMPNLRYCTLFYRGHVQALLSWACICRSRRDCQKRYVRSGVDILTVLMFQICTAYVSTCISTCVCTHICITTVAE